MRALPDYVCNPNPEVYRTGNYVTLDFETTNLDRGSALNPNNHLVLSCWYESSDNSSHHSWGSEYEQAELLAAIDRADFLVAHNAKFELHWLRRCGYDLASKPVYDTMIAEWVLAGNLRWGFMPSLEDCLLRRKMQGKDSLVKKLISNGVCPSEIPREWLLRYCIRDVNGCTAVMRSQLAQMKGTRLLPITYTRCLAIPVLTDIERRGMHLDAEKVDRVYNQHLEELHQVMQELDTMTGGINPRSPPQLARFIYGDLGFEELKDRKKKPIRNKPTKQFPEGAPKVDADTLLSLVPTTERQTQFLALKKKQSRLAAALDKNLALFQGACVEQGGMLYAEMNQTTTGTHRLSSSGRSTYFKMFDEYKGCQFQNLPNPFKSLFSPRRKGWYIGEIDYAQLEYRMAGFITQDKVIYDEVVHKHDVHRYTASIMYDIPEEQVTHEQRRASKPDTFKPVYGGTRGTKAQMKYYKAFQEKYHAMHSAQLHWCELVANDKRLVTEWGMVYYWPEAERDRQDYLNVKTKVFNYPIQAFATAEVVPIGLVMFWHRIQDAEMFLINTVHDSIECELPENEIELFTEVGVQALTRDVCNYISQVYGLQIDIPIGVGLVVGDHWGVSTVDEGTWDSINDSLGLPDYEYAGGEVKINVTVN